MPRSSAACTSALSVDEPLITSVPPRSSTTASLHRAPVSKRRVTRGSVCSARWSSTMRSVRAPQAMVVTCISLRVSVPVLSKQTTVAAASVSTASSRRMMTFRRRMSSMPSARIVVATAGKPSGTAATASDRADRNIWNRAKPRSQPMPNTSPLTPAASHTICCPRPSSCFCMGVCGGAAAPIRRWMRPTSVLSPVATTTARPVPPVMIVPR